jgi:ABC-2 type transport system ATP-binding protein
MNFAISIQSLTKTYATGTQALKGIDLEVTRGDFFALLGANGAGKTTIISILTGLVIKTGGRVKIFDYDINTHHSLAKKIIGVVPQEFNFGMFEKVEDIIVSQAGYYGIEKKIAEQECESILKRLSLWEKRHQQSRTLSGGMKRRLMIARALIHRPKLLILDEPTAGVDVELRHGMWEYLRELNTQGTTILLTTHYLEEVEEMCRNAAIIKNGQIIKNDRVRNLVQLLEQETYVVHVKEIRALERLKEFNPRLIDENTLELELNKKETLNDVFVKISSAGMTVVDMRPKGNRLEKLYLGILRQP